MFATAAVPCHIVVYDRLCILRSCFLPRKKLNDDSEFMTTLGEGGSTAPPPFAIRDETKRRVAYQEDSDRSNESLTDVLWREGQEYAVEEADPRVAMPLRAAYVRAKAE
jgi:hypothetical protein